MSRFLSTQKTIRPLIRPAVEYAAWPSYFVITRAVNQEAFYLIGLLLFLASDIIESPVRDKALLRDLLVGAMTIVLGIAVSDLAGMVVGSVVALCSVGWLLLKKRTV